MTLLDGLLDPAPADPAADTTTARILDAAYDQLLTFGLRRTSLEDVAKRAGVARITLYRHVGGRDELIGAVLRREAARVFAQVDAAVAPLDDDVDRLVEGFTVLLRIARSHPLLQRMLSTEADLVVPSLTTSGAAVIAFGREYLTGHLLAARPAVRLSPDDARAVAEVLVRLTLSFLLTPTSIVALTDDDDARRFARRFVLPAVAHASTSPEETP